MKISIFNELNKKINKRLWTLKHRYQYLHIFQRYFFKIYISENIHKDKQLFKLFKVLVFISLTNNNVYVCSIQGALLPCYRRSFFRGGGWPCVIWQICYLLLHGIFRSGTGFASTSFFDKSIFRRYQKTRPCLTGHSVPENTDMFNWSSYTRKHGHV